MKYYIQHVFVLALAGFLTFPILVIHAECMTRSKTSLNFDLAKARVVESSLKLKSANERIHATTGNMIQNSLLPNPEFFYELEGFGGTNVWRGFKGTEVTYGLKQLIQLGGKRHHRTMAATFSYYASIADYEVTTVHLLNQLSKAFIDVAAFQELFCLSQQKIQLAKMASSMTNEKLEAGKVSSIQKAKADMNLSQAEIEAKKAWSELITAKTRLSLLWGSQCPDFDFVCYPLNSVCVPLPLCTYINELDKRPILIREYFAYLSYKENVKLAKADSIPDMIVGLGYKIKKDDHTQGFIFGLDIPLPIFNQNQGNILKARAEASQAEYEFEQVRFDLQIKLSTLYNEWMRAYYEIEQVRTITLELARQTVEMIEEGHREGKFEYFEALDAKKDLIEIQEKQIKALVLYHYKKAEIEYLTNQSE